MSKLPDIHPDWEARKERDLPGYAEASRLSAAGLDGWYIVPGPRGTMISIMSLLSRTSLGQLYQHVAEQTVREHNAVLLAQLKGKER